MGSNTIIWTEEKKERAICVLTKYFEKYGNGECIMQSDNALIEAPEILSNIADTILIEGEGIVYEEKDEV
jgi:hypothetical protein